MMGCARAQWLAYTGLLIERLGFNSRPGQKYDSRFLNPNHMNPLPTQLDYEYTGHIMLVGR